jgi:hypothetical protein
MTLPRPGGRPPGPPAGNPPLATGPHIFATGPWLCGKAGH